MRILDFLRPRPVGFTARLDDGSAFAVKPRETLLEAALRAGLQPPHNCRAGACTSCRCRVVAGRAVSLIDRAYVLEPADVAAGSFLACQTELRSDVQLVWPMAAPGPLTATLLGRSACTPRTWRVTLELHGTVPAQPGQSVALQVPLPGGTLQRTYSVAQVLAGEGGRVRLVLDVAVRPGGRVSAWLARDAAPGATLEVEAPAGECVAGTGLGPLLAVGAGSGIGAAAGVLQHAHRSQPRRATALLAYGRRPQDVYGLGDAARSAQAHGATHFGEAWVQEAATDAERFGRAPAGLCEALERLAAADASGQPPRVLLFGPPRFVDACVAELSLAGLAPAQIRFDRYEPAPAPAMPAIDRRPACITT